METAGQTGKPEPSHQGLVTRPERFNSFRSTRALACSDERLAGRKNTAGQESNGATFVQAKEVGDGTNHRIHGGALPVRPRAGAGESRFAGFFERSSAAINGTRNTE